MLRDTAKIVVPESPASQTEAMLFRGQRREEPATLAIRCPRCKNQSKQHNRVGKTQVYACSGCGTQRHAKYAL